MVGGRGARVGHCEAVLSAAGRGLRAVYLWAQGSGPRCRAGAPPVGKGDAAESVLLAGGAQIA